MASQLPIKNLSQLETVLEKYLVKSAPALPANIKEAIVKYSPYLIAIMVFLSLPAILTLFGLSSLLMPISLIAGAGTGFGYTLSMIILAITLVLEVVALPGLFKRQLVGWRYMFYATLLGAVTSLLQLNLVGLILGTLLGLYVLFQVKSYYR